ncbi:hypothetical protein EJ06DRAFT_430709 [Trichodelitschia bisporula]|uniref:Uncharacterized protein n=1 Tax=Trichodelitschia bisporula TaxID=703511 RepID=A0A6G1HWP4_9PEZI|nr:hypothetical protein EJ06DRAFT_430709 [Trichodelitschia bisporula]
MSISPRLSPAVSLHWHRYSSTDAVTPPPTPIAHAFPRLAGCGRSTQRWLDEYRYVPGHMSFRAFLWLVALTNGTAAVQPPFGTSTSSTKCKLDRNNNNFFRIKGCLCRAPERVLKDGFLHHLTCVSPTVSSSLLLSRLFLSSLPLPYLSHLVPSLRPHHPLPSQHPLHPHIPHQVPSRLFLNILPRSPLSPFNSRPSHIATFFHDQLFLTLPQQSVCGPSASLVSSFIFLGGKIGRRLPLP